MTHNWRVMRVGVFATYLASDYKTNPAPALSHGGLFMGPVQLSSHYQDDRASHAGYCPNEEDQFRHQYPIATHLRLNCLDESAYPSRSVRLNG